MSTTPDVRGLDPAQEALARFPVPELVRFDVTAPIPPEERAGWTANCDELLARWDHQQWSVAAFDFRRDASDWEDMGSHLQHSLQQILFMFLMGDNQVTTDLAPLQYATPHNEERLIIGAQIGDEALHTHFFRRFFRDVVGLPGSLTDMLAAAQEGRHSPNFRPIFDHLAEAVRQVRDCPQDANAWVAAVTLYHMVVEAYVAMGLQQRLLEFLRTLEKLPEFTTGFTNVLRDEVRHVETGRILLRRRVRENPEMARVVARHVLCAGHVLALSRSGDASRTDSPKSRTSAYKRLRHNLEVIGLSEAVIALVEPSYK